MIFGIGTDLVNIDWIVAMLDWFGDRFCNCVFIFVEQAKVEACYDMPGIYAKCWVVKEACSKVLGIGLRMGIVWKDMAVLNLHIGQLVMAVIGWVCDRLDQMMPVGYEAIIYVMLIDDHSWVQVFVVIEAWLVV